MIILDTDHVSLLQYANSTEASRKLIQRLNHAAIERPCVTIITVEERMRGWLAAVAKERLSKRQVIPYRELERLFDFFGGFSIVSFDERAAEQFDRIRGLSVGAMDLKIAAICLVNGATLLTRNARDFARVPGLTIEDWTL
jgi:tRNA(fMet)-specific endonuclease VapC